MRPSSIPSNPAWERLLYVVAKAGHLTITAFARSIGLKSADSLYNIPRKEAIGKSQANRINRAYPRFSASWLVSGEGDRPGSIAAETSIMSVNGNPILSLPVYSNLNAVVRAGRPAPDSVVYISRSLCNGGTFAAFYNSDALSPKLPKGALLMLRPCDPSEIVFGCLYYIVTPYSRSYRILKPGKEKDKVRLTSCRRAFYPDTEIARDSIRELYMICATFNLTYPIDRLD